MGFDPKAILARRLDGLADGRYRKRMRRWLFVPLLLALLLASLTWEFRSLDRILSLAGLGREEAVPPGAIEVFRKMTFLPQARRVEAPDFFLRTLDGQNHTLKQHRGKVVLINFWATWCPPCIREMPAMQRLYDRYRAQGLEIVAISLDQGNPDAVRVFVGKLNLSFPIVLDPEHEVKQAFQVRALPTSYLVDRQGRVVAWGMGPREWDGQSAYDLIEYLLGGSG